MNVEKLLRLVGVVLDEVRTQIRSMEYPNGISRGLYDMSDFLEKQARLTRQMFEDHCRESECSCYKCGLHFWLTMPVKQERELCGGLPEICVECWEPEYGPKRKAQGGTGISQFRDPQYRYRRETIEQAHKRRAKEDGEASA